MMLIGKSVLVLGLGETGLSLVRWLSAKGATVRVADSRNNPPSLDVLHQEFPAVEVRCGIFRSELLDGMELIAISPGVPLRDPFVARAAAQGRLFGSVGPVEIVTAILDQKGIEVDQHKVLLAEHLKEVGSADVSIELFDDVVVALTVEVIGKG